MVKELSKMTNKELWELFPIILSEHDTMWKENYLNEKVFLEGIIGQENIVRMNHYGSTSVLNLIAKPTVDILIEIKDGTDISRFISNMNSNGYIYSKQPNNPAPYLMFMKGYTPKGFQGQVFHIHVRYSGDWGELYFRDYLLAHKDIADKYGKLKLQLKKDYEHDRDGYTYAKSDFIKKHTELAREEFKNKYTPRV